MDEETKNVIKILKERGWDVEKTKAGLMAIKSAPKPKAPSFEEVKKAANVIYDYYRSILILLKEAQAQSLITTEEYESLKKRIWNILASKFSLIELENVHDIIEEKIVPFNL